MGDNTCISEDCRCKPHPSGRGFCLKHYLQGIANGSLPRVRDGLPKICAVDGCSERVLSRGWCSRHYHRWKRHGDPLKEPARGRSTCQAEDCTEPVVSGGRCSTHDWRFRRHGSTELPPKPTLLEKFYQHVDSSGGPHACHPWTGIMDPDGYGIFTSVTKQTRRPHRWLLGPFAARP